MTIGERIRKLRQEQGLSQHDLARKAGVRRPTISELESGKQQGLTVDTAKRLARALGVGIDYLAGTWEDIETSERVPAVALTGAR
jgi:transcriptional regulator with XRE-family HTH domain